MIRHTAIMTNDFQASANGRQQKNLGGGVAAMRDFCGGIALPNGIYELSTESGPLGCKIGMQAGAPTLHPTKIIPVAQSAAADADLERRQRFA